MRFPRFGRRSDKQPLVPAFEFVWGKIAQSRMAPAPIVERLDIAKTVELGFSVSR